MRRFVAAVLLCLSLCAAAAPGAIVPVEAPGLRAVAGWLQAKGTPGYVGADVADAIGIARQDDMVEAMQRGFRQDDVLRVAQVIRGETLLFMVQSGGEVYFYLSSVRGGLRKALVSVPSRESVMPLDEIEAQANFRRELLYWEDKAAGR
jgi:fructose-1,6-bisphosphatase/sedoheptulose 1,7-bisphosphatase-like protein